MKLGIHDVAADKKSAPSDGQPEERQFGDVAASIGSKNLMIAIITMPFVFLVVVMGILAVFGSGPDEEGALAQAGTPGAVRSQLAEEPAATIEEPALSSAVVTTNASAEQTRFPVSASSLAQVGAIALDGDQLAVRVDEPEGAVIVIYDLSTNEVVQRVPLAALATEE